MSVHLAAIGLHGLLFLSLTNFILLLKIADRFSLKRISVVGWHV